MAKIDLKNFEKLINKDNLDFFHKNIEKQIDTGFKFCNSFIKEWHIFCSKMIDTDFFKEMLNKNSNREQQLNSNSMIINNCKFCNKNIDHYQKGISINFNSALIDNFFCVCSNPEWNFNKYLFQKNWDFFIFNWILMINSWSLRLNYIAELWNHANKNMNDITLRAQLKFDVRSILEDIYMKFDSIKFNLFTFNLNCFLDERLITEQFLNKNKEKIKENQRNPKILLKTIEELLEKNNKNIKYKKDLDFLNMISIHDNPKEIFWIINDRNNLMHNYFNIHGNWICIGFPIEERLLHVSFLLLYDNPLFLYFLIKQFN